MSGRTLSPRRDRSSASAFGSGASSMSANRPSPRRSRNLCRLWLGGAAGSAGDMSSMLLPPSGTHIANFAPRLATLLSDMSLTGIPSLSLNVATVVGKSRTAIAMRGIPVIMMRSPCAGGTSCAASSALVSMRIPLADATHHPRCEDLSARASSSCKRLRSARSFSNRSVMSRACASAPSTSPSPSRTMAKLSST